MQRKRASITTAAPLTACLMWGARLRESGLLWAHAFRCANAERSARMSRPAARTRPPFSPGARAPFALCVARLARETRDSARSWDNLDPRQGIFSAFVVPGDDALPGLRPRRAAVPAAAVLTCRSYPRPRLQGGRQDDGPSGSPGAEEEAVLARRGCPRASAGGRIARCTRRMPVRRPSPSTVDSCIPSPRGLDRERLAGALLSYVSVGRTEYTRTCRSTGPVEEHRSQEARAEPAPARPGRGPGAYPPEAVGPDPGRRKELRWRQLAHR